MSGPEIAIVAALVALAFAVVAVSIAGARRARAEVADVRSEAEELRSRLGALDARLAALSEPAAEPDPDDADYLITDVGSTEVASTREASPDPAGGPRPDGRLFTDLVVRETIVKAGALTYGLRRALSPASRNRIRFEMRQEVQAARKQRRASRKAELREARRVLREAEEQEDAA